MIRFSLRLPPVLYQQVVNRAAREHRSTNQQIVALLEAALDSEWVAEDYPGHPSVSRGDE